MSAAAAGVRGLVATSSDPPRSRACVSACSRSLRVAAWSSWLEELLPPTRRAIQGRGSACSRGSQALDVA
jgi:hypothetical protein